MKHLKVKVTKTIANGGVKFIYPTNYDAKSIMVEAYEHQLDATKNSQTEFCYGLASDDFPESVDMVVIPEADYNATVTAIKNPA